MRSSMQQHSQHSSMSPAKKSQPTNQGAKEVYSRFCSTVETFAERSSVGVAMLGTKHEHRVEDRPRLPREQRSSGSQVPGSAITCTMPEDRAHRSVWVWSIQEVVQQAPPIQEAKAAGRGSCENRTNRTTQSYLFGSCTL